MNSQLRSAAIVAVVLLVVGSVAYVRSHGKLRPDAGNADQAGPLPRIVDLGAGKCVNCKQMAPILEELKTELTGRAQVEFIDVLQDEKAGERYAIRMIPTQIFYDRDGKETWRHEGFLSKEDILSRLREAGMN